MAEFLIIDLPAVKKTKSFGSNTLTVRFRKQKWKNHTKTYTTNQYHQTSKTIIPKFKNTIRPYTEVQIPLSLSEANSIRYTKENKYRDISPWSPLFTLTPTEAEKQKDEEYISKSKEFSLRTGNNKSKNHFLVRSHIIRCFTLSLD